MKRVLWTLAIAFALGILGTLAVMYLGLYNVAASNGEGGFTAWMLGTTMDHSVRSHAAGMSVPKLEDSSLVDEGFDHYKEMCIACHSSPAGGQSETGVGLNPPAPELSDAAKDWTAGELYWIVKNGVKMTGMPAYGPTHSERELWGIVAFLQKLKGMNASEYKTFVSAHPAPEDEHEHHH